MVRRIPLFLALALLLVVSGDMTAQTRQWRSLVSEVQFKALLAGFYTGNFGISSRTLHALATTPRHDFMEDRFADYAYRDAAIPIKGSTRYMMAEPFLAATMIDLLGVTKESRVLEIGYGSGYETALLSKLAGSVHSVHHTNPAKEDAFIPLEKLGYNNVTTTVANLLSVDDKKYDAILVKQSLKEIPKGLVAQLETNGRLVIPLGKGKGKSQILAVFVRMPSGELKVRKTLPVAIPWLLEGEDI